MSKELKLGEIARLVGGRLVGDPALCVKGAAIIRDATSDDITLADRATLFDELSASSAAAVIVPDGLQPSGIAYIQVRDVRAAFAELVMLFRPHTLREAQGISPFARIESSTVLGENVNIHAGATVGADVVIGDGSTIHAGAVILAGCRIGRNVTIFPNAVLYENTIVGDRCRVHAGAVIGAFGFGYETKDGQHLLSAQLGYVEIGDDVDIGACTTIDRGTYGATIVGSGTKIDNQVMIGHNCRIGKGNIICSQVGIAGSCTTGDYVVMAGQVGIRDHVHVGDRVNIGAKSGVGADLAAGETYLGVPALPSRTQMQIMFTQQKLPAMRKELKQLLRIVEQMQLRNEDGGSQQGETSVPGSVQSEAA